MSPSEVAEVQEVEGSVTATGADGLTVELGIGSSVYQGDVLETSSDGAVNILFLDGTTFALGGDAKMVPDELIYDASANTGSSLMSVVTGTFVFITGEVAKTGPEAMQVRTPAGTIGIRGTKVGCNLDISDGVSICILLPQADGTVGEFVFSNEGGSQVVSNAFEAVIANAFNASLTVSQVLPSQLQAIFEGLPTSVLEAQAAPAVLGAGGTVAEGSADILKGSVLADDDSGVDGFGGITQFVHDGKTYDPTTSDATADVISNDGDTIVIVTKEGGEFTFTFSTGAYGYAPPDSVDNSSGDLWIAI